MKKDILVELAEVAQRLAIQIDALFGDASPLPERTDRVSIDAAYLHDARDLARTAYGTTARAWSAMRPARGSPRR